MPIRWIGEKPKYGYTERIAWLPVRAFDTWSLRYAWVWLREIRVHDDGKITFSSFWC